MAKNHIPPLKLKEQLQKQSLSKRQFAKLLGVQYPAVFEYFRPGYNPKLSTLYRFSKALSCKIRDLIDER